LYNVVMARAQEQIMPRDQQFDWAVLYDLDGVVVNSSGRNFVYYVDVFESASKELKLPADQLIPSPEVIASCYPLGLQDAIATLTPDAFREYEPHIYEIAKKTERHAYELDFPDYINEHFTEMRDDNCGVAIVTNASGESVDEVFTVHPELKGKFNAIITSDDGYEQKPSKEPLLAALEKIGIGSSRAFFIGDTARTDGEAARSAGVKFIHFTQYEADPAADAWVRPDIYGSTFSLKGLTQAVRQLQALVKT
jgi:HAD superfamily hydrolase (TIGR01549 family)